MGVAGMMMISFSLCNFLQSADGAYGALRNTCVGYEIEGKEFGIQKLYTNLESMSGRSPNMQLCRRTIGLLSLKGLSQATLVRPRATIRLLNFRGPQRRKIQACPFFQYSC